MLGVGSYDGFFLATNPAYTALLGWSQEELQSVPYWELLHPDDQHPMVEDGDRLMREGGRRLAYDARILCRNGTYKWTRWNTTADEGENVLYAAGVDITDLKPPIMDPRVAVGTWIRHVPTRTLKWSEELYAMFGFAADERLDDEQILKRVHPDDRIAVTEDWSAALAQVEVYAGTIRVNLPDGRLRLVHSSGRVMESGSDGSPISIRGITIDVTDRRTP
jgi:PAS domain S-box-containing protein